MPTCNHDKEAGVVEFKKEQRRLRDTLSQKEKHQANNMFVFQISNTQVCFSLLYNDNLTHKHAFLFL